MTKNALKNWKRWLKWAFFGCWKFLSKPRARQNFCKNTKFRDYKYSQTQSHQKTQKTMEIAHFEFFQKIWLIFEISKTSLGKYKEKIRARIFFNIFLTNFPRFRIWVKFFKKIQNEVSPWYRFFDAKASANIFNVSKLCVFAKILARARLW